MRNMSFTSFYQTWHSNLEILLRQLMDAPNPPTSPHHHETLRDLVQKTMSLYTEYSRVKSVAARQDVLSFFSAPWFTSLEKSLFWVGGWRPTTLSHLVITESSISFESRIVDILNGVKVGDLSDLSASQLSRLSKLQCETVAEENAISDELGGWQNGASDLLTLSFAVRRPTDDGLEMKAIWDTLKCVIEKADNLRLRTLRNIVELLTPQQAVEFLIAAVELHFGVRGWGLDARRNNDQD